MSENEGTTDPLAKRAAESVTRAASQLQAGDVVLIGTMDKPDALEVRTVAAARTMFGTNAMLRFTDGTERALRDDDQVLIVAVDQLESLRRMQKQVEADLSAYGYRMQYDLGAIPGEGHAIETLVGNDVDVEELTDEVRELALQWSNLTEQIELLVYEADELTSGQSMRP